MCDEKVVTYRIFSSTPTCGSLVQGFCIFWGYLKTQTIPDENQFVVLLTVPLPSSSAAFLQPLMTPVSCCCDQLFLERLCLFSICPNGHRWHDTKAHFQQIQLTFSVFFPHSHLAANIFSLLFAVGRKKLCVFRFQVLMERLDEINSIDTEMNRSRATLMSLIWSSARRNGQLASVPV